MNKEVKKMAIRGVSEIDELVHVKHVLASVFDKSGLEILVPGLLARCPGVKIISTGGTYSALQKILGEDAEKYVTPIEKFTRNPETEGGLVKTLSREKSLALLAETYCAAHQNDLRTAGVPPIDVVICNLYPFAEVVAKPDVTPEMARGNIDIGGPNMLREAGKNFLRCASIVDPADYFVLLDELRQNEGTMTLAFRLRCMKKAFDHVARYDRAIADHFANVTPEQVLGCYDTVHRKAEN
jgi:phosphoribosylaminoimidazolecarboxamide formyltransferase/IMP cyclohydrolase